MNKSNHHLALPSYEFQNFQSCLEAFKFSLYNFPESKPSLNIQSFMNDIFLEKNKQTKDRKVHIYTLFQCIST